MCGDLAATAARMYFLVFFFFNDTATTEIYTLSLHDALPICRRPGRRDVRLSSSNRPMASVMRSEEHTSELQSRSDLVCRLLLEKKNSRQPAGPCTCSECPPPRGHGTCATL